MSMDPDVYAKLKDITMKLHEVDRKLDFLFKHLNVHFVDVKAPFDEIEQLVVDGDRIGAIKLYMHKHKADLVAAKNAIENIIARLGL